MPFILAKYNTQTTIYFPMVKRAVVDLAVTADWTPAGSDCNVSKDGGAQAQATNTIAIASGTTWKLVLTATELSAAEITVMVVDAATKAVEDQWLTVYTYGNASAKIQADLSDAVRLGLTALPNANAEAAGGLYTRGTGAGQIEQEDNGKVSINVKQWLRGTIPAVNVTGVPKVDLVDWLGSAPDVLSSGKLPADLKLWLASAPDALSSGKIPADVKLWLAVAMNALISGRVDANAQVVGDKTSYTLSAAGIQAIWDALTSALTTVGSVGKRIADFLSGDAYVRLGAPAGASVSADIAALPTATGNADALLKRDMSAVSGEAARSPLNAFRFLRNLWTISGGTLTVKKEDDSTTAWTAAVTQTAGNPVSQIDPT